jgi:hypothetical protein
MRNMGALTRTLAVVGTVLAWLPIVATVVMAVPGSLLRGAVQVDYLMPAELFPVALAAGAVLLWAALRARSRVAPIAWGLGLTAGMLVGGQALAVATGLASGATQPSGVAWAVVMASLVLYTLLIVELGVAGVLLVRDVFASEADAGAVAPAGGQDVKTG